MNIDKVPKPDVVQQAFNPNAGETEADRSLCVSGQPDLRSQFQVSLGYYLEGPCFKMLKNKKSHWRNNFKGKILNMYNN